MLLLVLLMLCYCAFSTGIRCCYLVLILVLQPGAISVDVGFVYVVVIAAI